jgi:4-hydroxymandelate oxidase
MRLVSGPEQQPLVCVDDFEAAARERLPRMVFDYFAGGAGDEWTLRENRRAFDRWVFRPRTLVDISARDLGTTVLGQPVPFPILIAPTAFQRMAHSDGEMATARAAASLGTVMVLSTIASTSLEDVATAGGPRWFQLYVLKDRDLTAELVRRAHANGYTAIAITVDAPTLGRRERDERNRFTTPTEIRLANLHMREMPEAEAGSSLTKQFADVDPSVTWEDLAWLRSLSPLPILLKGVMTAGDAVLAVEAGMAGLIVSNHGGRQLDGAAATIDALPEVVAAAAGRLEVLVDGGIRRGTHVLKALALGARAVLVGRPAVWGLAVDGEAGVRRVLELLRDELSSAMALAGACSVDSVPADLLAPAGGSTVARQRGN